MCAAHVRDHDGWPLHLTLQVDADRASLAAACIDTTPASGTAWPRLLTNTSFRRVLQAPVELPQQCRTRMAAADGGYVTVTLERRHVQLSRLAELSWELLTFQERMQFHIKSFGVS